MITALSTTLINRSGTIVVAGAAMAAPLFGLLSEKSIPSSLDTSDSSILVVTAVIALETSILTGDLVNILCV